MSDLIDALTSWKVLLLALLVYGFAPGAVLRLIVLGFRMGDPRRIELRGELNSVPWRERPIWVAAQLEVALFEGVLPRVSAVSGRLLSSGTERTTLPRSEITRRRAMRAIVVLTSLWSGVSIYWTTKNLLSGSTIFAIAFAIAMAFVVFGIDTLINGAPILKDGAGYRLRMLAPRLPFAIVLGLVTGNGLAMTLFRSEIIRITGPSAGLAEQLRAIATLMGHDP